MKVLKVDVRESVSKTNGMTYKNYSLVVGVPKSYGENTVLKEYTVRVSTKAIQDLISSGRINKPEDLEGKNVRAFREAPIYLSNFERQYNSVECNVLLIDNSSI